MSCTRNCFDKDWKYGDIDCIDCPYQDSGISEKKRKELLKKLKENPVGKDKEIADLNKQLVDKDAEIRRLTEIIESTANVLDDECPDIGAYPDGHCSLVTVAKLWTAEVVELKAEVARLKARELDATKIIDKINSEDEQPCNICHPAHYQHHNEWVIRQMIRKHWAQAIVDAREEKQ